MIVVTQDAERKHCCGDRADRRKYKQIGPIDPTLQYWKILGQRVSEDSHQERQHAHRENGNLPMRHITDFGLAFLRQPARAEKSVAKAEADTAKDRERRQPTYLAAGILAVGELQPFHQGTYRHALYESRDQGSAGEAQVPNPAQPLSLVTKLERHTAQDQAEQHHDQRE